MSCEPKISTTTGTAARPSRRRFLAAAPALAAGLATTGLAAPAIAQDVTRWRLVTAWPKDAPGPGTSARRIAERIGALSGGRLEIELYAAGELVPAFEVLDAVSQGTAEIGHAAAFFWAGKLPPAAFFIAVPFGLSPEAHNAWIYEGGGQALYDALYAPLGVKPYLAGNSGLQMGGWYRREIKSLEDVKGLKIRMPGIGGEVMRRLGATAVSVPPGEIFPALQTGTVDAAEFLGPWSDLSMGFDRVAPYYYWPGFHEPNGSAEALVNAEALAALPTDLQALVAVVCEAENARGLAEADWMNAVSLEGLQSSSKVKLRRFPDDVLAAARQATEEILDELAGRDAETKRIYESYRAAQRLSLGWDKVARHALTEAKLA